MKIIFYRYKSICEPDFIDAFQKLGITVVEDWDGTCNELSVSEKTARLGTLIAENFPMFVFSINFFPFVATLCERLKIKYVSESVDCPVFEIFNKAVLSPFNRLFLFDRLQCERIREYNSGGIFYLPLGAATDRTSRLLRDTSGYKYYISFVGSLYNEKDSFLKINLNNAEKDRFETIMKRQMSDAPFGLKTVEESVNEADVQLIKLKDENFYSSTASVENIDGYVAINDYLSPHIAYLERVAILNLIGEKCSEKLHFFTRSKAGSLSDRVTVHGGVDSLNEMPFVFRQSKINLNITMRSIQTGIPQRVWDVLACEGFLITNDQPEIHEYFQVGKDIEVYRDKSELMDKINYYLEHEEERCRIAQNGYQKVKEQHTILNRVISMIKYIQ